VSIHDDLASISCRHGCDQALQIAGFLIDAIHRFRAEDLHIAEVDFIAAIRYQKSLRALDTELQIIVARG